MPSLTKAPKVPGTYAAAATSAAVIAQQVAGKAVRDALFLSTFHTASLPYVMALAAVLSIGSAVGLAQLIARRSPAVILPALFALNALGLGVEWSIGMVSPRIAAVAVYLHTALFGPAVLTAFWSFMNERFDPHAARLAVARIGSGGTLGGVLGGLAAWRAALVISLPTAVLLLAVVNAGCVLGVLVVRQRTEAPPVTRLTTTEVHAGTTASSTFDVLRKTPFLRGLALLVALGAAISSLLDYIFSVEATIAFGKGPPLLAFFSLFWLAVSVLSFLLQLTLGRIAMEKLGVVTNVAILPGIIILGGAAGIAVPGLTSSALLRAAEAVQRNTIFRSAYELLYTPLPEEKKRSTKAVIDVGFDRLGTLLGSGVALIVLRVLPLHGQLPFCLGIVIFLGLATLPITRVLHTGYVGALEKGLREGAKKLDQPLLDDHRPSIASEEGQVRDELIERVEALRPEKSSKPDRVAEALRSPEPLLSRARDLLSSNDKRTQSALEGWTDASIPLASFAVLFLAHKTLHREAQNALRTIALRVTGQLVDALLDPEMDFVVRRRIPRVLASCPTQRAVDGLVLGISDERFEVRYECGRALLKLTEANSEVVISREKVFEAILREAEKWSPDAATAGEFDEDVGGESLAYVSDFLAKDRLNRSVEHVFTILSVLLEREPLRMAFRALHQEDQRHRGTALEYLQTVLPSELRAAVWPMLGEQGPLPEPRPTQQILDDLARATGILLARKSA
ncbi:MAG: hypothetical protein M3O46_08075 [Myxococcota bacterium]|nr:hypothetical protein [Myxococcota bacterium]